MAAGEGTVVGRISIKVTPLLRDFWADVKEAITEAEKTLHGEIKFKASLDIGKLRSEVKAATDGIKGEVKVKTNLDQSDFAKTLAETKAAAKAAGVTLDVDFRDAAAEGHLAALIAKLKAEAAAANIKLKVDTEHKGATKGLFGGMGGMKLPGNGVQDLFNFGTPLNLIALLTLLPPALSVLSAGLLSLPALFTAVAAPIGVFALGLKGVKDALSASGFLDIITGKTKKDGTKGKDKTEPGQVIKDLQDQISEVFKTGLTPIFQNFANVLPQLTANLPKIATGIVDIIGGIGNALTSPAAIAGIQQLTANIGGLLSGIAPGIQSFIESLGKLATGVSNHFPGLANFFNGMADSFARFVTNLTTPGADGKTQLDAVVSNLKPTLEGIFGLVKTLFGDGTKLAQDPGLADKIKGVFNTISSFATDTLPALAAGFKAIADVLSLIPHVETPKEKEQRQATEQANANKGTGEANMPGWFDPEGWGIDIRKFFTETVPPYIKGLGVILSTTFGPALDGIGNWFTTTLPNAVSGMWSTFTSQVSNLWNGFISGAQNAISTVGSFFSGIGDSLVQAFNGALSFVQSIPGQIGAFFGSLPGILSGVINTAVNAFNSGWDAVVSYAASIPGKIVSALGSLGGLLVAAGKAAMDGLLSGIKAGAEAVYNFVSGIAGKIAALKGPLPYDRRVLTPNGMALMQGLQDGLEGGFEGVLGRTKQMADQLAQAVKDGLDISGSKNSIAQQLKEVQLEMDQLRVQRDALAKGDPQRKVLSDQMQQLTAAKDQLKLQGDNLGYAQKYGAQTDSTSQAAQMITKALASMLDMAKSLVMAPAKQLESDLGISGNGALPQIADQAIGWGMQSVNKMVQGAFGVGGNNGTGSSTTINVGNMDDALSAKRTLDARESMTLIGR